jgi:hypothetical protein
MLPVDPSGCIKHKFGTCPEALFINPVLVPPMYDK